MPRKRKKDEKEDKTKKTKKQSSAKKDSVRKDRKKTGRKKVSEKKQAKFQKEYSSYEEWASDFYSGYLYDPDGKIVERDCSMSVDEFLEEIDEKISILQWMSEEDVEKIVSRLIQWKNRICEEANIRFLRAMDKIEGR